MATFYQSRLAGIRVVYSITANLSEGRANLEMKTSDWPELIRRVKCS